MTSIKVTEQARGKLQDLQEEINKREYEIDSISRVLRDKDQTLTKVIVTEQISRADNKNF